MRPPLLALLVAALVVILDQATKALVVATLAPGEEVAFGPISWHRVHNTGIAFGLFDGYDLLKLITLVIALVLIVLLPRVSTRAIALPWGLVLGGALGNLIDRAWRGYVLDFVDFGFWPAFNLADTAITVGAITLLLVSWRRAQNAKR